VQSTHRCSLLSGVTLIGAQQAVPLKDQRLPATPHAHSQTPQQRMVSLCCR
jgi:hypothetical protein